MTDAKTTAALSDEQVVQTYNRMRQEQSNIMSRIAELEAESHEHDLVAEELRPLNADRCCHRLIGGALVERTVGDVLPEIEENLQRLREALKELGKALTEREKKMDEFMALHKLSRAGSDQKVAAAAAEGNRGVLA